MQVVSTLVRAAAIVIMVQTVTLREASAAENAAADPGSPQVMILNAGAAAPDQTAAPNEPDEQGEALAAAPVPPSAGEEDETAGRPDERARPAGASEGTGVENLSAPSEARDTASEPPASKEAAARAAPSPEPTLDIDIDLSNQKMHVTENGMRLYTWPISSGRYGHETPTGTFQPTWMAKMWYSRQYDYSPMPHSIFFHRGAAIHGTYYTSQLGRPASAGCVRLAPQNAARLYKLVTRHGKNMTRIVVRGKAKTSPPAVASRKPPRYAQWGDDVYYALPPAYYRRRPVYGYSEPYYAPARKRRGSVYYGPPRGYYARRGLFNSYGVYGF